MAAHRIKDDAEAIAVATSLAARFAEGAGRRDRERALPFEGVEAFSASGLWAVTVPRSHGGAEVSNATLARIVALIAAADPSLAQIPQSHFVLLDGLRLIGSQEQKVFFFGEVLAGKRIGNAFSETGGKDVLDIRARLEHTADGWFLTGRKAYATGALYAHWVPVSARDDEGNVVYAYLRRDAPGLTVVDDWNGLGQRTTASGTVIADRVAVEPGHILRRHLAFATPSLAGPFSQLLHASIDLGIGRGAFDAAVRIVREVARPWIDSGRDRAADDPHSIAIVGDLQIRLHAAEALVQRAARFLDEHRHAPTAQHVAEASVRVAEARVLADDIALQASNRLLELGGTRTALASAGYDRHWRDARTHTLHDPVRWKRHHIGNHTLNGTPLPLHVWV
ncbi:SfnB family sulfur acquisition oxidoreductase [Xylophilus sp.]|uniref:SfnB family sulfur acquisition oxidoreductase n=1 Tax=Xylophilus sp. TaxID=2653893 RepID=UPI0013BBCABB|nr:SfnB family sulfur acquisition oxidoreductase [Xylophilus sp.]KAF1046292.1 MAG: Dibenzothiophene desulfurization enzyme C [Xylophilus sp.]